MLGVTGTLDQFINELQHFGGKKEADCVFYVRGTAGSAGCDGGEVEAGCNPYPLDENFNITDDNRMRAALPTLKKILADGGSIIIGSHLGRPKGPADKFSLKHILKHLSELLGVEVQFANDCMGEEAAVKAAALQPGEVLLLENLRFYAEEEGKPRGLAEDATDEEKAAAKKAVKESQKEFTKKLASYADCYVNDAFGTAHRAHASTALIAKYFDKDSKMFGYLMEKEVKAVDKVLNDTAIRNWNEAPT